MWREMTCHMRIVVDRCRHFLGNFVSNNVSSCLLSLPIEPNSIVTDNDLFYSLFSVTIVQCHELKFKIQKPLWVRISRPSVRATSASASWEKGLTQIHSKFPSRIGGCSPGF